MLRTKGNWNWYQLVELHIVAHDVIKNLDWLVFRSKIEVGDPAAWAFEDCPAKYADVGQLKTVEINFPRPGRIEIKRSSSILTWGICWPKLNLMDPPPPLTSFALSFFPVIKFWGTLGNSVSCFRAWEQKTYLHTLPFCFIHFCQNWNFEARGTPGLGSRVFNITAAMYYTPAKFRSYQPRDHGCRRPHLSPFHQGCYPPPGRGKSWLECLLCLFLRGNPPPCQSSAP